MRKPSRILLGAVLALSAAPLAATTATLVPGATINIDATGSADLQGVDVGSQTAIAVINGAQRGFASSVWASMSLAEAQSTAYGSSGNFIPGNDLGCVYIYTAGHKYYKLRFATGGINNDSHGIDIEYVFLGSDPPPPVAAFTFDKVDLIVYYTDTSTGAVSSRAWDFDNNSVVDGTTATPKHVFPSANTYTTCFTATNSGGADAVCHSVAVSQVTSTTRGPDQTIDMDGDFLADLQVKALGCGASIPLGMHYVNGTRATNILKDYRTVVQADAQAASAYSTNDRCVEPYDVYQTILIIGTTGHYIKAWQPANTASGIRFQFAVMGSADLLIDGFEVGSLIFWQHHP